MSKARGKWHRYRGIPTIVTYHPAYLLRKPESKKETWEDLQMLMKEMGLQPPPRRDESAAPGNLRAGTTLLGATTTAVAGASGVLTSSLRPRRRARLERRSPR